MDYHITWYKFVLVKKMGSDLDISLYLRGQGYTIHLKVRVPMLVSALLLTYD